MNKSVNKEAHVFFPVLPQVQKLMRKKQLDVAEFSVYWDVDCTFLGDLPQVELQVRFWWKGVGLLHGFLFSVALITAPTALSLSTGVHAK